jgi:hypothetical protein
MDVPMCVVIMSTMSLMFHLGSQTEGLVQTAYSATCLEVRVSFPSHSIDAWADLPQWSS